MTDPTPDLCCTHGAKLDRAVELLEALVEARAKQPRFATGGIVNPPPGTPLPIDTSGCEYTPPGLQKVITAEQIRSSPMMQAALKKFREETIASNPSPAVDLLKIAEVVAEATIAELERRGRLLP